jgi:hypothetical protein
VVAVPEPAAGDGAAARLDRGARSPPASPSRSQTGARSSCASRRRGRAARRAT